MDITCSLRDYCRDRMFLRRVGEFRFPHTGRRRGRHCVDLSFVARSSSGCVDRHWCWFPSDFAHDATIGPREHRDRTAVTPPKKNIRKVPSDRLRFLFHGRGKINRIPTSFASFTAATDVLSVVRSTWKMDETTFGSRFKASVANAYVYATSMVAEPLPPILRVNLSLNASYDGIPLEPGEVVFPEDSHRDPGSLLQLTVEEAARILWRDELVPEWIDVNVVDVDESFTVLQTLCCGRFTRAAEHLYHATEGYPPFHVLSPELPPGWESVDESGRFSIRWRQRTERRNRRTT